MFTRAAQAVAALDSSKQQQQQDNSLCSALQQQPLVTSQFTLEVASSSSNDSSQQSTHKYLIAQGCAGLGTPAWELAKQVSHQLGTTLVPWAAVAFPLLDSSNSGPVAMENGSLFCFLPLPASSGLPIHINGTFEVASNRRDLWHGADLLGLGKQRASWNAVLLSDIAAPLYATLLAAAAAKLGPSDGFYKIGRAHV